jgi:hypothetical protein
VKLSRDGRDEHLGKETERRGCRGLVGFGGRLRIRGARLIGCGARISLIHRFSGSCNDRTALCAAGVLIRLGRGRCRGALFVYLDRIEHGFGLGLRELGRYSLPPLALQERQILREG